MKDVDIDRNYAQGHEYPLSHIVASRNTSTLPHTCPLWLRLAVWAILGLTLAWSSWILAGMLAL